MGTALALVGPLILLLPLGGPAMLAALSAPLMAVVVLRLSRRAFGGIGGDAAGATGEATRAVLLVILSGTV